jgi:DNA polymerase III delta prime subunit
MMNSEIELKRHQELLSVTFVNTDRFPFAKIEVDGNTMISGTNGVGKTTTIQAVLFFYGVASDHLGIKKNSGDVKWREFAYPLPNSYAFYEYEGVSGKNLVFSFGSGKQIGFKFARIPEEGYDLTSAIFADGAQTVVDRETLIARLHEQGVHLTSKTILGSEAYSAVIYGKHSGGREFADFALMRTTSGYEQIPNMLSSIFLNSSMKDSTLEDAIAGALPESPTFDLKGLRKDCVFIKDHRHAIRSFESMKAKRNELYSALEKHKEHKALASYHSGQIAQMLEKAKTELPLFEADKAEADSAMRTAEVSCQKRLAEAKKDEQAALEAKVSADKAHSDACDIQKRYSDGTIHKKIEEVGRLASYREIERDESALYGSLIQGAEDVDAIYNDHINSATATAHKESNEIFSAKEKAQEASEELLKENTKAVSLEINNFNKGLEPQQKALDEALNAAEENESSAQVSLGVLKQVRPADETIKLKEAELTKAQGNKEEIAKTKAEAENTHRQAVNDITGLEEKKKQILNHAQALSDSRCAPLLERISQQKKLLNVGAESLLGFIRTSEHPAEGILTSLLKDEVLLSEALSPVISDLYGSTVYGLGINEDALDVSRYDSDVITATIDGLNKEIEAIRETADFETKEQVAICTKDIITATQKRDDTEHTLNVCRTKAVEVENTINRITEELEALEKEAEAQWREKISEMEAEVRKLAAVCKKASSARDALFGDAERKRLDIRERYEAKAELITGERKREIAILDKAMADAKKRFEERIELLNSEKRQALEAKGVDTNKQEAIKARIDAIRLKISQAEKWTGEVELYKRDKAIIDSIEVLHKTLQVSIKCHSDATHVYNSIESETDAEMKKHRILCDTNERKIARVSSVIREAIEPLRRYEKRSDIEIDLESPLDSRGVVLKHDSAASRALSDMERESTTISRIVNMIRNRIKAENTELFPFLNDDEQDHKIIATQIVEFSYNGGLEAAKEMVALNFFQIIKVIRENHDRIMRGSDKAREIVNGANRVISEAISGIPVLDELKLEYRVSEEALFARIEKVKALEIPVGDRSGLFWESDNSTKFAEAYREFERFIDELDNTSRKAITVSDTYSILFGVAENSKPIKWARSRDKIGSTGTTVIAKTLIYIALLEAILRKSKLKDSPMIHVLVDEVGTLSQSNMKCILDFANSHGIALFNAAPEPKLPRLYNRTYLYQLLNGKARVSTIELKAQQNEKQHA